jgi:hypothetical protein
VSPGVRSRRRIKPAVAGEGRLQPAHFRLLNAEHRELCTPIIATAVLISKPICASNQGRVEGPDSGSDAVQARPCRHRRQERAMTIVQTIVVIVCAVPGLWLLWSARKADQ